MNQLRKKKLPWTKRVWTQFCSLCSEYRQREESLHSTMPTTEHLEPSYALACENPSLVAASSNFLQTPIAAFFHFFPWKPFSGKVMFRGKNKISRSAAIPKIWNLRIWKNRSEKIQIWEKYLVVRRWTCAGEVLLGTTVSTKRKIIVREKKKKTKGGGSGFMAR